MPEACRPNGVSGEEPSSRDQVSAQPKLARDFLVLLVQGKNIPILCAHAGRSAKVLLFAGRLPKVWIWLDRHGSRDI